MGVLTAFLALLSCALIGTGAWLVLRDTRRQQAQSRRALQSRRIEAASAQRAAAPASADGHALTSHAPAPGSPGKSRAVPAAPFSRALPDASPPGVASDWRLSFEAALLSALRAVNGAFEPTGIVLVRDPQVASPRDEAAAFLISIMAQQHRAGGLRIAVTGDEIEIAATSGLEGHDDVRRLRRLPGAETSIPALAETIAACAWPIATVAASHMASRR